MASFCKDCSIRIFGKDFGDFAHRKIGLISQRLCEGCSEGGRWIWVDWAGRRYEENYTSEYEYYKQFMI